MGAEKLYTELSGQICDNKLISFSNSPRVLRIYPIAQLPSLQQQSSTELLSAEHYLSQTRTQDAAIIIVRNKNSSLTTVTVHNSIALISEELEILLFPEFC